MCDSLDGKRPEQANLQSGFLVVRGWAVNVNRDRASFWGDELYHLGLERCDGCTLWMYLMTLNCTLENGEFYPNYKNMYCTVSPPPHPWLPPWGQSPEPSGHCYVPDGQHGVNHSVVAVLVTEWCRLLCNPMDCSSPGSSDQGISQARKLEWVATPFYRGSSLSRDWTLIPCIHRWILYH